MIEALPKSILIQIAALYHKIGLQTSSNGKNGGPADKPTHRRGRTVLDMSRSKIGLTKTQVDYVKTLINAFNQLDNDFDFQTLRKTEKLAEINRPDFLLLVYAIKSSLNRIVRNTWTSFLRKSLQQYFTDTRG
jgi:hypothetical protein